MQGVDYSYNYKEGLSSIVCQIVDGKLLIQVSNWLE